MGPWLVTRGDIADPTNLQVLSRVNGETKHTSNTCPHFRHSHQHRRPERHDYLRAWRYHCHRTCGGIGAARQPPEFLKPGDVMETEIPALGCYATALSLTNAGSETPPYTPSPNTAGLTGGACQLT
jgi:hypothetical protein